METKRFEYSEFEDLLKTATEQCLQNFIEKFSDGKVSKKTKYIIPNLKRDLLTSSQVLEFLLRKDGLFRPSIRLSPFARTESETVISVSWGDDVMDLNEWVDVLPPEGYRSKLEPFLVMSPDLNDLSAEDLIRFENAKPIGTKILLPFYKK